MSPTGVRRYGLWAAALVVCGLLVLTTVLSASSVDANALRDARPIGALDTKPLPRLATALPCSVAGALSAPPAADRAQLTLAGACTGSATAAAACNPGDDALAASVQVPLVDARVLTLTVIVPDYTSSGAHDDADVFVQVTRAGGAQRWSARGTVVQVSAAGELVVASTMTPDPGTRTVGRMLVHGRLHCNGGS